VNRDKNYPSVTTVTHLLGERKTEGLEFRNTRKGTNLD
jgi:hypothetical protein